MVFSDVDQLVTLYGYENDMTFAYSFEYMWAKGTGLAANSTLIRPPEYDDDHIPVFDLDKQKWKIVLNKRGHVIYSIDTKEERIFDQLGDVPEGWTLLCPNHPLDYFLDGEWVDISTFKEHIEFEKKNTAALTGYDFQVLLYDIGKYDQFEFELQKTDLKTSIEFNRKPFIHIDGGCGQLLQKILHMDDVEYLKLWKGK